MSKLRVPSLAPLNDISQWKSKLNTLEYSVATATVVCSYLIYETMFDKNNGEGMEMNQSKLQRK
jgi:hypothetical protein